MYQVRPVAGKGLGCVACRNVVVGELVLREEPAMVLEEGEEEERRTIEAFLAMTPGDQSEYLQLGDMFTVEEGPWPQAMLDIKKTIEEEVECLNLRDISKDTAVKILQIKETNSFHNGVFLRMSRFNHSCTANAEHFWSQVGRYLEDA